MAEKRRRRFEVVPEAPVDPVPGLDSSAAHPARIYDYWLGGKDNFPADRAAAEQTMRDYPGIVRAVRAQRAFLGESVRYLAGPAAVRQFLDIGTGIPAADNTHEVAQAVAPECRVVYVDNDPLVLVHARALLTSGPQGITAYLDADLRDTSRVLERAAETLDFTQPIAILLLGILQLITNEDAPHAIVRQLVDAVPSGSWLAIACPASDVITAQVTTATRRLNERSATPITLRTREEIARFFDGLDLLRPGLVQLHRWAPGALVPDDSGEEIPAYCGLARKT